MSGVPRLVSRSRPSAYYATRAGRRLSTWHGRRDNPLARLGRAVWESSWLVRQTLVALLVFGLVFGLLRAPLPGLSAAREKVKYYLTTDFDFRGAARQVFSGNLRSRLAEGWRAFPDLWNRLTGHEPVEDVREAFILPVGEGTITSTFGYRPDPVTGEVSFHTGIDISAPEDTPILAALGGTVLSVEETESYGKVVEIDHGQGTVTLYAHAKTITVKVGDTVNQGDPIATVGKTGRATTPHCHFEVIISGQPVDPLKMQGLAGTG